MKYIVFTITLMLTLLVSGSQQVTAVLKDANIYKAANYAFAREALIYNRHCKYRLVLSLSRPGMDNVPYPVTKLRLYSSNFGFGALNDFITFNVNDISMYVINTDREDMQPWQDGSRKGVTFPLRFDGVFLKVTAYMIPDSPCLFFRVSHKGSLVECRSMKAMFSVIPSSYVMKDKKVIWQGDEYRRKAITSGGVISQSPLKQPLNKEKDWIILHDELLDGSGDDKGTGPSALAFQGSGIADATVLLRNSWTSKVNLNMKPGSASFNFAIWQPTTPTANNVFINKWNEMAEMVMKELNISY